MKKLITIFVLCFGVIFLILGYILKQKEIVHEEYMIANKHYVADFIFDKFIPKTILEAEASANSVKLNIVSDLDTRYSDKTELKDDLQSVLNQKTVKSEALELIGKSIKGVTLNSIKFNQDNNDIIFLAHNNITNEWNIAGDYSLNCVTTSVTRDANTELAQQFSKSLFVKAFNNITNEGKVSYWSFLEPSKNSKWYNEVRVMNTTDLSDLKKFFIKYEENLDCLNSFEILVPVRIYDTKDYFGDDTIFAGVRNQKNMQFVVVQGFNIVDQLNKSKELNGVINDYQSELKSFALYKIEMQLFMVISFIIFAILFITAIDYKK